MTTVALPHDWCNYGGVIEGFKAKYGLEVNELNPDAGSADELEAIRANKDNKGPQAPDVIDVGYSFGPAAQKEGLLQPYKVSTWDTIPDDVKDPDGHWYGDYYGVMSFMVNEDLVPEPPADWADLLKPEYAGSVALAGDPQGLQPGDQRRACRRPRRRRRAGQGGRPRPASKFFAELNKAGNFVPVTGKAGTLAQGATPDRHLLGLQRPDRPRHAEGQPAGRRGGPEDAAWSPASTSRRSAPSRRTRTPPSSGWSTSIPTRASSSGSRATATRSASTTWPTRGVIPQALLDKLPPAEAYEGAVFPTLEQQEAMAAEIKGELGQRRRRQRAQLAAPRPPAAPRRHPAACRSNAMARPHGSGEGRPVLGVARHRAVPGVRAAVPDPADDADRRRRLPRRRRAPSRCRTSPTCSRRRSSAPSGSRSASASPRPSSAASSASRSPGR